MWGKIQKRLRRFRLLREVLEDAKAWVSKPWTNFYRSQKQVKDYFLVLRLTNRIIITVTRLFPSAWLLQIDHLGSRMLISFFPLTADIFAEYSPLHV